MLGSGSGMEVRWLPKLLQEAAARADPKHSKQACELVDMAAQPGALRLLPSMANEG